MEKKSFNLLIAITDLLLKVEEAQNYRDIKNELTKDKKYEKACIARDKEMMAEEEMEDMFKTIKKIRKSIKY